MKHSGKTFAMRLMTVPDYFREIWTRKKLHGDLKVRQATHHALLVKDLAGKTHLRKKN